MIPDCVVGELRATVFVSPIIYDANNLQRVQSVLTSEEGYMPNIVPPPMGGLPLPLQMQLPNHGIPLDWEMASQKTNFRIHFGPQKIDVLKSAHTPSPSLEEDFCKEACHFLKGIIEKFQLIPTRLAYAPVYTPEFDKTFKRSDFLNKTFALNKFGGADLNTLLFKQGFLLNEIINGKTYKMNYVADASEGQSIEEQHDDKGMTKLIVHSMLNLALDINTRQGEGYSFTIQELEEFFSTCIDWAHKYRDYYVSIG